MADALIVIYWLICAIRGTFRGAIKEVFSIVGILSGLVAAAWLYLPLAAVIPDGIVSDLPREMISFFFIFGMTFFLLSVSGVIVGYLARLSQTGWLNRAFGVSLGFLKGILVVALLLVTLFAYFPQKASWFVQSTLFPYETLLAEKIADVTPAILHRQLSAHIDVFEQFHREVETSFMAEQ
jgi:membrane protein required for colicin V production